MGIKTVARTYLTSTGTATTAQAPDPVVEEAPIEVPACAAVESAKTATPTVHLSLPAFASIDEAVESLDQLPALLEGATPEQRRDISAHYTAAIRNTRGTAIERLLSPNQSLLRAYGFHREIQTLNSRITPLQEQRTELLEGGKVLPGRVEGPTKLHDQISRLETQRGSLIYKTQFTEVQVPYKRMKSILGAYERSTEILSRAIGNEVRGLARPGKLDETLAGYRDTISNLEAQVKVRLPKAGLPAQGFVEADNVYLDEI